MLILETLSPYGFRPLELTKIVRNGMDKYRYMQVRHQHGSCIALGHGAGGNLGAYFYSNDKDVPLLEGIPVSSKGKVYSEEYRILDGMVYSMEQGHIDFSSYSAFLGYDVMPMVEPILNRLLDEGLLEESGDSITFTKEGLFWGNNIIDEIISRLADGRRPRT